MKTPGKLGSVQPMPQQPSGHSPKFHKQKENGKVKQILEGCLDLISSSSPSMKIQIVGAKIGKHDKKVFLDLSTLL